ncbi:MAG TPA: N-acetyl-gamma-glutamyl-phosphate reductase [Caldimonas sp.]|nr:N-acetyl-gamma-glutamyl-phosphate reductase [Caldimonas sp.]
MKPHVFIDGSQGTTGVQICERLRRRDDIALLELPEARREDARWRAEAINDCDIAILCLPEEAARAAAVSVTNPAVRIIDASSAHRLHPDWIYGFAELAPGQRDAIAAARRVANPGCYPTGAIALVRPLVDAGLMASDHPVTVHAISGYSGRGRPGIDEHDAKPSSSRSTVYVYGLALEHKHVAEIETFSRLAHRPFFVPAYGAFRQGLVLTIPLHVRLLGAGVDAARVHACLASRYAGFDHVEVTTFSAARSTEHLDPQALNDTDRIRLGVFGHARNEQILLTAVLDNLGKGAAGAAEQNLDLMLHGPD